MNATSTHDTKRSEDVRARINTLSEIVEEWEDLLKRWKSLNEAKKISVGGRPAPDPNEEIFLIPDTDRRLASSIRRKFPLSDSARTTW